VTIAILLLCLRIRKRAWSTGRYEACRWSVCLTSSFDEDSIKIRPMLVPPVAPSDDAAVQ
jgi:hypothetical protein